MTTEAQEPEDDMFFKAIRRFVTFDRMLMIGSMMFAAGMWWNAQNVRAAVIEQQFANESARITLLEQASREREKDLSADRLSAQVTRAEVSVKLAQLGLDVNDMRAELKALSGELRKIR